LSKFIENIAVLHTWGQNLSLHLHIHCLVPAAGITLAGNMRKISKKGRMNSIEELPRIRSPMKFLRPMKIILNK